MVHALQAVVPIPSFLDFCFVFLFLVVLFCFEVLGHSLT